MSAIISVEHLGKQYRIGALRRGNSFRDAFDEKIRSLLSRKKPSESKDEVLWALKDVSFQLEAGEVLGIIGRNGAGKSTLLKILSRITGPTEGLIRIGGRVAALLEVGTGFSGELTGRENIFLNGSILGMKRAEILSKFDEIVAFAEMERFIDTPVKRYSSGMYMRLAFAIAAHLDPEILIVDEVLAVGDAQFQKKSLGRIEELGKGGRTVLFVTHNTGMVRQLCSKALLLHEGKLRLIGESNAVTSEYERMGTPLVESRWENNNPRDKQESAWIGSVSTTSGDGVPSRIFRTSEEVVIAFSLTVKEPNNLLKVGFDLTKNGVVVMRTQQVDYPNGLALTKAGEVIVRCRIPRHFLNNGEYFIIPLLSIHCAQSLMHQYEPVLSFEVAIDPQYSSFYSVLTPHNHPGMVFPSLTWEQV
ncbi:MAG TPA: ABC transporter ATP-binding protein [Bacteroidota bacterium]|nr:ABC transporter ATP-binding protein [Bacteroidota bacterium]